MSYAADLVIVGDALLSPARRHPPQRGSLRIGLVQESWHADPVEHTEAIERGISAAAAADAELVLLQELVLSPYFAGQEDPAHIDLVPEPLFDGPTATLARRAASRNGVTVHASLWEAGEEGRNYNTAICVSPHGDLLHATRKWHIPHFPGYYEHRYFSEGDSQFDPVEIGGALIGLPTCWDQWFPEVSRSFALAGADVIVYPTAIGSEPLHPSWDTEPSWQAAIVGQAVTNGVFMVAVNRTGREGDLTFYGSSFVCDPYGRVLVRGPRDRPAVMICDLDLDMRRDWLDAFPMLSDRRPEIYRIAGEHRLARPERIVPSGSGASSEPVTTGPGSTANAPGARSVAATSAGVELRLATAQGIQSACALSKAEAEGLASELLAASRQMPRPRSA